MNGPRRLIEVDLPISRISAHARREKSIRHGHISTLHIWWARRPLAACRAVVLAALWPDPVDPECPDVFRDAVRAHMAPFWRARGRTPTSWEEPAALRQALLDFIAEFADWERSADPECLRVARALTQAAHESLSGPAGTRPLVVDPFAGGGAIPLEALRVGADAFASDLNPVAVLLNKVVLEYVPRFGTDLADAVRHWGTWVKEQAEADLGRFYPADQQGGTPIAYIWARTIRCDGPGCGAELPLIRSLWLAKKRRRGVALELDSEVAREGRVVYRVRDGSDGREVTEANVGAGTVRRGSATCPCCGYTTPVARVREQLRARRGGAADARLMAVVSTHAWTQGRFYREPNEADLAVAEAARVELAARSQERVNGITAVPDELFPANDSRAFTPGVYGIAVWGDLFTPRQLLALTTLARYVREATEKVRAEKGDEFARALGTCLGLSLDKAADLQNSLCGWKPDAECPVHMFARQAIPIVWDYAEAVATADTSGSWESMFERTAAALDSVVGDWVNSGQTLAASATSLPLPDGLAQAVVTDPPYYDAVPYADLSDFFYVWLRRTVGDLHPDLFRTARVPKSEECVVNPAAKKDKAYFERTMAQALVDARRVLADDGIGVVVFAHKSTAGWEAMLRAMIDAGWVITGSWPIDTEMGSRLRARNSAALASSVHLACRPRTSREVGDWRDVLEELPRRVGDWLPRLASEGVVGADAIFACLGPALEVFSRYASVERPSGEAVGLGEYLEQVWAAVARQALSVIFEGADASGFEEDGRLTAMWLWTLFAGKSAPAEGEATAGGDDDTAAEDVEDDDEGQAAPNAGPGAYALDFDTARKIAQGLGVHLDAAGRAGGVVAVRGETARLLTVREREAGLLGSGRPETAPPRSRRRQARLALPDPTLEGASARSALPTVAADTTDAEFSPGRTVLDRLHQAMLLFGHGRTDALRRLLVDEGAGTDARFWRLAQALSALYPRHSEEKRWLDAVLASRRMLRL